MQLHLWITVLLVFAQMLCIVKSAEQPDRQCSHALIEGLAWYAIERPNPESEQHYFNIYDNEMKRKIYDIELKNATNNQFRLFIKANHTVVGVRCAEDEDGINFCGYKEFEDLAISESDTFRKDWNIETWGFKNFTTNKSALSDGIDMSKILLVGDILYLNSEYLFDLKKNKFKKVDGNQTEMLAGCFDEDITCGYDLVLDKIFKVKNDKKTTMYYFDRMRFSYDEKYFLFDNFIDEICYESLNRFVQLLPFLSPKINEMEGSKFYSSYREKFTFDGARAQCPTNDVIAEVNTFNGTDDDSQDKYFLGSNDSKCPEDDYIYFVIFIIAAAIAGLLTMAFIAVLVIVLVARKKMIAQGKNLPKKPWETQATEDQTIMDQTVGVTEATTIGGETSAYTTVGA